MSDLATPEKTLGQTLNAQASALGDRVFLDFRGEVQITYRQIEEVSSRFANGLLRCGISKGTKVAVMLSNCPEYLYCWFGLAKIGAVMVPVNTAHKGELLRYILDSSDSEAVVVDSEWLDRLHEIESELPKVRTIFVRKVAQAASLRTSRHGQVDLPQSASAGVPGASLESAAGKIPTRSLSELSKHSPEPVSADVSHSDPMTILFTSGTTGPSKGVVMSHNYYHYAARTISAGMEVEPNDVLYTCLPLFHVNAQVCTVLSAMIHGARVAMYEHFSASSFWDEVRSSKATMMLALGAMGNILYKAAPQLDDSDNDVRLAMVVPPPEDLEGFERRFGLRVVYETFGLTEGIVAPPRIFEPRRPGCCGKPGEAAEVSIVDEFDESLPPHVTGEIVMRPREPYAMMSGYYKMPEETLDAFRNLWFHTGDLGYMDEEGFLYFVGRKKEAIRRRGENISAFEVERIVNQHPAVLESAAIPVPSELSEDDVKVVVVLNGGRDLRPEDLIKFCEDRMAYFMVPRFVEFRDCLPKTPTQRVEKYKLRAEGHKPGTWDREQAGYQLKR
jgi:crotonobetaine/carnitine-CoA ligase